MPFWKKPKTDFNAVVIAKIKSMSNEGFFENALNKAIEDAASRAIENLFDRYGDFGKALEEGLRGQLNVDLKQIGLEGYNDTVAKIVKRLVEQAQLGPAQKEIEKTLADIFEKPPTEIKLSDLVDDFYDHLKEDYSEKQGDKPTIIVENDGKFCHVFMDGAEGKQKYSCKYQIDIHIADNGRCYGMKIGDIKIDKTLFMGNFYQFEKKLFQIYTAKVPVIIGDFDPDDLPYYDDDY